MEGRYHSKREQLETARREVEDFEFSKRKIEERIGEIIEDREQIEERLLEEIRRDSSQLTKRIRALLEARRFLGIYSTAKCDNERYQRAYELFRKGTWEKG
ncbi:hypothetical protein [Zunongwangia profunda]|uniref:hypothetical protein n=1 Tax=Zunongwangia profunda TaxID=398743 RepID=UPI000C66C127|nr:hypothetical protein [Zunongwangia profunda]MAS71301.1 hypothetical protein [Zunongwangia sp.]